MTVSLVMFRITEVLSGWPCYRDDIRWPAAMSSYVIEQFQIVVLFV